MGKKYLVLILAASILVFSLAQRVQAQKPYFFTVTITSYPAKMQYVEYMESFIEEIGINVEIESLTYGTMMDLIRTATAPYAEGGYDIQAGTYYMLAPAPPDATPTFHTRNIYPEGTGNLMSYSSGRADRLMEQINAEPDVDKQKEMFKELQAIIHDDLPVIPLYNYHGLQIYSKDVQNAEDYGVWEYATDDMIYCTIFTSIPGKDTIVIAGCYQWTQYCPLLPMGYWSFGWGDQLVRMNPEGIPIPSLAKFWEFSEDLLTVTFHLRNEDFPIVWSDGEPFTSKDVKFTFDSIKNPDLGATKYSQYNEYIESIEAPDDYTVILHMKKVYAPIITVLADDKGNAFVPEHIFKDIPVTEWATHEMCIKTGYPSLGPYEVEHVEIGQYLRLKTNHLWWGWEHFAPLSYGELTFDTLDPPYEYLVFKYIPEKEVALMACETGEVNELDLYYHLESDFPSIKENPNLQYDIIDIGNSEAFSINLNHPILGNKWVRKAIDYALPRGKYIEEIMYGLADPQSGPLPVYYGGWLNPEIDNDPYDVEKAKECMEKAGYNYELIQPTPPEYGLFAAVAVGGIAVGAVVTFALTRLRKRGAT